MCVCLRVCVQKWVLKVNPTQHVPTKVLLKHSEGSKHIPWSVGTHIIILCIHYDAISLVNTHTHTDTQTHRHTDTQTHRHTDTHTHAHTRTRTHTHTHTRAQT